MKSIAHRDLVAGLAGLSAALLLAGCGNSDEPAAADPTASDAASASASPSESEGPVATAPDTGDAALQVGEWREGEGLRTRLVTIESPLAPDGDKAAAAGNQLVGLQVEQCGREGYEGDGASEPPTTSSNAEWTVVTSDGGEHTGGESFSDWPEPPLPPYVELAPGACESGWLTVEVPEGSDVERVRFAQGEPVAEWLPQG